VKQRSERFKGLSMPSLLIYYAGLTLLNFLVLIFQSAYYGSDTIHNLIWYSPDFPVIGLTEIPQPFGNHFFGDFLHVITAATRELGDTPYYPYLPASLIVGEFFSWFPYAFAVGLYFIIFFSLYFLPVYLVRGVLDSAGKLLLSFFLIFNIGTLYLFDRGNIQLVVSACLSAFIYFYAKQKHITAAVFLGIAASIKLWPILFIWPMLRVKEWRPIIWFSTTVLSLNILPLLIFNTNGFSKIQYIREQFDQIVSFGSIESGLWHAGGKNSSLTAMLYSISEFTPIQEPFKFLLEHFLVIQVLGLLTIAIGLLRNQLSPSENFLFIALFVLLFPSAQYGYSASILIPILIFHFYEKSVFTTKKTSRITHEYKVLSIMLALLPISYVLPIEQSSVQWIIDVNTFLTPAFLLIAYIGFFHKSTFGEGNKVLR
jgi:hypothetical protein